MISSKIELVNSKNKYHIIAGIILSLAGVVGSITLDDSKYSLICLLGVMFLLIGNRSNESSQ
jgi:hypothetical protein